MSASKQKFSDPGLHLREKRLQARLRQGQLGEILGVTTQAISGWERNIAPIPLKQIPILEKIIKIDGNRLFWLISLQKLEQMRKKAKRRQ